MEGGVIFTVPVQDLALSAVPGCGNGLCAAQNLYFNANIPAPVLSPIALLFPNLPAVQEEIYMKSN